MRAIVVDDEQIMVKRFLRLSSQIEDLIVVGDFTKPLEALEFAQSNPFDIAFLDVKMPKMSGIDLAKELRKINPALLVVFVSAYDEYVIDANRVGADYYIVKPFKQDVLTMTMEKMRLLAARQKKSIFIQTFGRFVVFKDDEPVPLTGKAKEILALVVTRRGKEISNEEVYSTIWEGRPYSNDHMKVYYNALSRLRSCLEEQGLSALLVSTKHGQMVNTALFDCDYYDWKDKASNDRSRFEGEFLAEYSWAEYLLGEIMNDIWI